MEIIKQERKDAVKEHDKVTGRLLKTLALGSLALELMTIVLCYFLFT